MTALEMRAARTDELALVEGLLAGATAWLASRGSDQWQFPPRRERLLDSMSRDECFLAWLDDQAVGTVTVDEQADPEFWQPGDEPSTALYVHRMAIARDMAGLAVGARMLDWAADRAVALGKSRLRLDAWKTNPALHQYYLGQGFALVRIVDLPHRQSGALFERKAGGWVGLSASRPEANTVISRTKPQALRSERTWNI
ncbi:GNAT family N-acetyltransferase [Kitasatospora sp. NPDC088391]|uniref:GNAT family N-acetyltransferase n=1 Tax=Kitasatospora sp. NPDC088391 TaxID=3364074 RepID=UPI0038034460